MSDNMQRADSPEDFLRKFPRELPVTLNESELQQYGKMLAEKCKEQELALEKKKLVTADHNNRIKVITNEIKRIADARAKGEELRSVTCGERLHGNVIEIVRLDRSEVVDTRPADIRDLQQNLPGVPEMPEDLDEGPRGDDMGGPDKSGRSNGHEAMSSAGDTVHVGGDEDDPDMVDDDTLICDACGKIVTEDDETIDYEGSTIHIACKPEAGASMPHLAVVPDEGDDVDTKLAEREQWKRDQEQADKDLEHRKKVEARDKAEIARLTKEQAEASKPKRERSKAKNTAKSTSKRKK